MQKLVKYAVAVALILFPVLDACAQQEQLSIKRHPGEHIQYSVTLAGGDGDKTNRVTMNLNISGTVPSDQPGGTTQFGATCTKSSDPKIWNCDVVIPQNAVNARYRLNFVQVASGDFYQNYNEDFHVPTVEVENSKTFTPPSVTVKQQP